MNYNVQRFLARLGLAKKPPVPSIAGGPHLATMADAARRSANREAAVLRAIEKKGQEVSASERAYVASLVAGARLLGELARAAAAGDARR